MSIRNKILSHLCSYKNDILKISDSVFYSGKKYSHILPLEMMNKNLITSSYLTDMESELRKLNDNKKIHVHFSHLNSSQAFTLNLLIPIIKEDLFYDFLGIENKVINYEFEHQEKDSFELAPYRKTNFDFYAETKSAKFFFEIKYSELSFGTTEYSKNKDKYKKVYEKEIKKLCKNKFPEKDFFRNYQLWRNICHVIYGNVCFVLPSFRQDLIKKIENAKSMLNVSYQTCVQIIKADEFVRRMEVHSNVQISEHYKKLYRKYFAIDC